ncbi:MAG: sugar transferase [Acidobacteria bacterium]|nr:sugar transferase [Acidobacteriota bacterium]
MYLPWGKRTVDLLAALLISAVALPLLAALAICVRIKLGSPVLFVQRRTGQHGASFLLRKFRTMNNARDEHGALLPDAERLSPFGAWLRSTSVDELPSLLNVLRGEMSLVGPRPLLPEYLPRYSRRQATRHDVPPGITGLVQVTGRNALDWSEKLARDAWYARNQSFKLDLWILWRTIIVVLKREGIAADTHATMPRFGGRPEG